jgi:hypothetical protein
MAHPQVDLRILTTSRDAVRDPAGRRGATARYRQGVEHGCSDRNSGELVTQQVQGTRSQRRGSLECSSRKRAQQVAAIDQPVEATAWTDDGDKFTRGTDALVRLPRGFQHHRFMG